MTKIEQIVRELKSNYGGRAWHGTALRPMLDGVHETKAFAHLIPNARSIAELLGVPWSVLVEKLEAAHAKLIETAGSLREEDLQATVAGKKHSVYVELHGLMHHNTYHAAQIAMLKKF